MMNIPLKPAVARLENAMKTTIYHWCEEIGKIVEEYPVKELQNVFPLIVENLFELHLQTGWSMRTLTKSNNPRDFDTVSHLLSPRGPLIILCYKLLGDSTIKYEFPLCYIPAATRHMLEEGVIPSFYVGKLQYHPQLRVPSCLVLNAFEYYMMHFIFYLVNPNLQKYATNSGGSDSVYFAVLEEYLQYFLPCNGCDPDPIQAPSPSSSFGSPIFNTSPKTKFEGFRSSRTPSLLKKSSLTPTSGTSSLSADRSSHHDSWRTMVLLHAISELWLSHVNTGSGESSDLQHPGSPSRQISILQTTAFLPSLDHLRAVRMLTKHLHYFANSSGPNIITELDDLKRTVWSYFQKKLYVFLRHTLEHWPLDASFRLFLETWLSYIQPWRYVSYTSRGNDSDKVVDSKWQNFVAENLLFYTLFLEKVIHRFLRVELSSTKTALMLYRISKVYSQKNVKEMILQAENSQTNGSSTHSSSQMAVIVRQSINDLESPSFNYAPLFGQEITCYVRTLLMAAAQAKTNLRISEPMENRTLGWWARIYEWFINSGPVFPDENGEEAKKALGHLELASSQLASLFEIEMPSEPESLLQSTEDSSAMFQTPVRRQALGPSTLGSQPSSPATLGPHRRFDLSYRGNPDTRPICSYEVPFLVRMLHQISTNINEKFGSELEQSYERRDFVGKVVRQLLYPPTTYQEVVKKFGTPNTIQKRLPPRICLRTLANRQVVGYTLGLALISYGLGWAPEILILILACFFCGTLFVRASLESWREAGGRILIDEDSFTSR